MNKMNILLLVSALSIVLLLSGCNSSGGGSTAKRDNPYVSGTEGLSVSFEPNSIPNPALDNGQSSFQVAVHLMNKGSFTIPAGKIKVSLSGFSPQVFGVTNDQIVKRYDADLNGVSKINGQQTSPGQADVVFPKFSYKYPLSSDSIVLNLVADICYYYESHAVGYLCVKKNPYSTDNTVCTIAGQKQIYSSAAPIQISDLNEELSGSKKLSFSFKISQSGNGIVYKPGSDCDVTSSNMYNIQNKVFITITTAPDLKGTIKCSSLTDTKQGQGTISGYLTLYNKNAIVSCTEDLSDVASDFEPQVFVNVTYDYDTTISSPLVIKKSE